MGQGLSLQLRYFLTSPNAKIWILELCYQSILLIGSINAEPDIPAANTIEIEEEQQPGAQDGDSCRRECLYSTVSAFCTHQLHPHFVFVVVSSVFNFFGGHWKCHFWYPLKQPEAWDEGNVCIPQSPPSAEINPGCRREFHLLSFCRHQSFPHFAWCCCCTNI